MSLLPLTIMEPDTVDTEYPVTLLTLYEYDPLGSENEIVSVVEDSFVLLSVTDHDVPDGNPDSENVIVYLLTVTLTWVNVMLTVTFLPSTFTLPDNGDMV